MSHNENITNWFTDAATRHPTILHTAAQPRFFEMEFDLIIQNGQKMAMKDWTIILEDHKNRYLTNGDDYHRKIHKVAFWVVKQVKQGNKQERQEAYNEAEIIGEDIIGKLAADSGVLEDTERCSADVPDGVEPPWDFDLSTVESMPIGPEFDNAYGMRFTLDWNSTKDVVISRDRVEWEPLA